MIEELKGKGPTPEAVLTAIGMKERSPAPDKWWW